jgi:ABC-type protease/lipase transport system fused ATPase/permease subunit
LARALYGDPFLVVLDEPNSNLDADGEAALTRAILRVRQRGGIVVVIAHHPSALAGVDSLMVMSAGCIKAVGAREEIVRLLEPAPTLRPPLKLVTEGGL